MKLKNLQNLLKTESIDLLLLLHPDPSIAYLSEVEASYSVLQVTKSDATILLSALDDLMPAEGIESAAYTKKWKDELKRKIDVIEKPRIGINKAILVVKEFELLQKEFVGVEWIDFSLELEKLRLVKTEKELTIMFKAAAIADSALSDFVSLYRESKGAKFSTELSVALFLEKRIREQGATPSFPTIVATGKNGAVPHHVTSLDKLQPGLLLIDMGAKINGYCSDMTRMFSIGEPSVEEKRYFDLLNTVQRACIIKAEEMARSNEPLEILDAFARLKLGDYSDKFIHSLGHGIGVEVHESPRVSKGCNQKILLNMPFTIEPGIYFEGKCGLRIEDTVILMAEKIVRLTKSPKELVVL